MDAIALMTSHSQDNCQRDSRCLHAVDTVGCISRWGCPTRDASDSANRDSATYKTTCTIVVVESLLLSSWRKRNVAVPSISSADSASYL